MYDSDTSYQVYTIKPLTVKPTYNVLLRYSTVLFSALLSSSSNNENPSHFPFFSVFTVSCPADTKLGWEAVRACSKKMKEECLKS